MKACLAYLLTALLLLQTLGQELLVLHYELNKAAITARYCVNKARPSLRCYGQCHLARQLRKASGEEKKGVPTLAAKLKLEVLPAAALPALWAPRRWPCPARRYAVRPAPTYADAPAPGVFHPPLG